MKRNNKGQFVKGMNIKDKTNERHGRLKVIGISDKRSGRKTYWNCLCDCGNKVTVRSDCLGTTKSCGCLKKTKAPLNLGKTNLHGLTHHPVYGRWNAMINRCENPNTLAYKNYGERGIKVCDEWHDLKEFIRWSEENGFNNKLTLERIDVNGNYEPSNCKWIPMKEQYYNKRTSVYHTYNGETKTTMQWTHELNIPLHKVSKYKKNNIPFVDLIREYKDNTEVT
ncbi:MULTISPECIES: hypothetical protein [Staphylococcus]|uniref:hypothetical protein n=1 Tax=Staphylococcus TaxID=1279 RepID=UPI000207C567|nr:MULTISPECIES: hypothetical protein [Staphylococcus]MDU1505993.1 hypothetical protein [Limosilactobacillus vaginalis]EGG72283.1 hypothetical protein SEVCU045_1466 [Staphylococcus epidermidis VCU045]MCG2109975.1 hypothetical protein [Staphylococcus epidermidis]MCG2493229.1 hypothetical protein [Staphylococcus epidermidis]MCT1658902.1 hypothetical protein [Staphylococcus epidermidis]